MKLISTVKRTLGRTSVKIGMFGGVFFAALGLWFGGNAQSVDLGNIYDPMYCNNSAIIRCGVSNTTDLLKKYNENTTAGANTRNVFGSSYFGISRADVEAMGSTAVAGVITRGGDVMVGDQVVATGATTAGYANMANSTRHENNGTVFYSRAPSVSIPVEKSPAFVVMKDNKFVFAIIGTCGNPVKATPKTPDHKIEKDVQVKGSSAWSDSVSNLKPGTTVTFRVKAINTGQVELKNMVISDKMDAGMEYVDGSFRVNAVSADPGDFFSTGKTVSSMKPNFSITYEYDAVVAPDVSVDDCEVKIYNNRGHLSTPGLPDKQDDAKTSIKCEPKPVYVCDYLKAIKDGNRTSFLFVPGVTLKNVTFKTATYTVTDKTGATIDVIERNDLENVSYSQTNVGEYAVDLKVVVTVNGEDRQASGICQASFVVEPEPEAPVYECTNLSAKVKAGQTNTYVFMLNYIASGGAKLTKVDMDWGDSSATQSIPLDSLAAFEHTFAQAGSYTQTATLGFVIGDNTDTVKSVNCKSSITIAPEEEQPEVLAETGPGSVVGMFAATTVASMVAYRFVWLRRISQ